MCWNVLIYNRKKMSKQMFHHYGGLASKWTWGQVQGEVCSKQDETHDELLLIYPRYNDL